MKKLIFLVLLFSTSSFSQTKTFNQSSGSQLDNFKSNLNELKDENGINIFTSGDLDTIILEGEAINNHFGYSVSDAGDVNRDGYSDVIVGAQYYNSSVGRAYIYFGSASMNNVADVTLTGEATGIAFGRSVSSAGDVNDDGYADVIVGSFSPTGKAYIFFGGVLMDNVADVIFTGVPGEYFGEGVSTSGDVNRDGYDDVIIGAPGYSLFTGRAYIFFGGVNMNNVADIIFTGELTNSYFGDVGLVSSTGDVNGDGFNDIIVGAWNYNNSIGRAYIYFGGANMNNVADVIYTGEANNDFFGVSVSSAGDVNQDGFSDVIIGAYGYNSAAGRAYIYFGGTSMNNVADVIMTGESAGDHFGLSVSSAGDVNRDGYSDIIAGAEGFNSNTGKVYIFFGGVNMNNSVDLNMTGESVNSNFGVSVSGAGDVNGDGYSDIIIGAQRFNNYTGRSYVFVTKHDLIRINLKVLMEGMYYPVFNQMTRTDSVKVYLRNALSPYNIIDSSKGKIDSITFSKIFSFPNANSGSYYIVAKHFNTIESWSKAGGEALVNDGSIYNYDFTTSYSKSFGNNLKKKGTKYCMISGNVNQDFIIDAADISAIENDASEGVEGYVSTDLNGDNFVDGDDLSIVENNIGYGVVSP